MSTKNVYRPGWSTIARAISGRDYDDYSCGTCGLEEGSCDCRTTHTDRLRSEFDMDEVAR